MDYGDEAVRVIQLIDRVGIDFQPTEEYFLLLKNNGAPQKLIDALKHAKRVPESNSTMSDVAFAHLAACVTLTHDKKFGDAEKECTVATSEEPGVSYFALGDSLIKAGQITAALEALRSSEKADPSIPDTHNYIGLVLQNRGDVNGAMKEYEDAVHLDNAYETPHSNLAECMIAKGDMHGAEREARAAIQINSNSASAHNNLGGVYFKRRESPMLFKRCASPLNSNRTPASDMQIWVACWQ